MFHVLRDKRFVDAAGAVLAIYLATLFLLPKNVFWTPDEGSKWMAMHCVGFDGGLTYTVDFPSQRVDTKYKFLPHVGLIFPRPQVMPDGSLYLGFETPVLFPLLSYLPFRLFGLTGIYLLPLFSAWLVAVLAGAIAAAIRRDAAAPTVLVAGLATPLWFYGQLFWEHTPASLMALIAVAIVALASPRNLAALLIAMTLPLAASAFRMEILTLALVLPMAWVFAGFIAPPLEKQKPGPLNLRWPLPRWTLPIAALIAAVGIAIVLDGILTMRHHKMLSNLPNRLGVGWDMLTTERTIVDVLIHPSGPGKGANVVVSESAPIDDLYINLALFGVILCTAAAFAKRPKVEAVLLFPGVALLLSFCVPLLLQWNMYRGLHGLIPVAPFVAITLYAWASKRGERSYPVVFLTSLSIFYVMATLYAIAAVYVWHGILDVGIEWGQRYLLTLYPIAAVLCVVALRNYWESARPAWLKKGFITAAILMIVIGFGFQVRGLGMLYNSRTKIAGWDEALRREGPVVTNIYWLPSALAVFFTERQLYYVDRQKSIGKHKRSYFADWVDEARAHGIKAFTFVSLEPLTPWDLRDAPVSLTGTEPKDLDGIVLTRLLINQ